MTTPYDDDVARFTYKPDVEISCVERADGRCELRLTQFNADSRHPVNVRRLDATRTIAAGLSPEQMRDEILGLVRWWEEHELFEWARWDHELVCEPHDAFGAAVGQQDQYAPHRA